MKHTYTTLLPRWTPRPLAALGLLLATVGAAQAQSPTFAPVVTSTSGIAPYSLAQQPALGADPARPGHTKPNPASSHLAAHSTARPAATQRLATAWTKMAAMSQGRAEPGATAHPNGNIYVWGGRFSNVFDDVLASAEAYTPATNMWAPIASLPMAVAGPAAAMGTDGSIYSFGGRVSRRTATNYYISNSYKYNVATNTWAAIAPLPVARGNAQALTAPDGRIFVFGGWDRAPLVGTEVQIYNPATNTWSTGAPMPVGLVGSAAGVDAAGLMHVYGGTTNGTNGTYPPATAHLVYNVITNSWATAPATPTPARTYATGLAGPDGNLYLCGGNDNSAVGTGGTYYSQVDSYNPTTATWSSEPALPVALTAAASAATGGYLYVVGGFTGAPQSALYRAAVVTTPSLISLTSLSPTSGPVGTSITLTGTNLTGATAVSFNGTAATTFAVVNATTITATIPTGAITGPVTVTTPSGTATSSTSFVVVRVPPTTVADSYSTPADVTLAGNVLTNDLGTTPRAILILYPTHGTLILNPTGTFTYRANAGYAGPDSFYYYACDQGTPLLCGNPVTVNITVTPGRVAPVTVADSYSTPAGTMLTGNVLTNDLGTNPRAILIIRPTRGVLVLNPNGSFSYQPSASFVGSDSFIYYACDPAEPLLCGNPVTVSLTVLPAGSNARGTTPNTGTQAAASATGGATVALELTLAGHPNPFSDELQLSFSLPTAQACTLALYDAQGRLVQQLASGQAEAGQAQQFTVPTQGYATGLYFVRLSTATGTQLLKLIKQ